jgi:S-methylmethionine transporter
MSITASHFFHRRALLKDGGQNEDLAYKAPLFPLLPIAAFLLCVISLIGIGFDPTQATALYFGIPFVAGCYLYFHLKYGRQRAVQESVPHQAGTLGGPDPAE